MTVKIERRAFTWTPYLGEDVMGSEVRCTHRGDVEHGHYWTAYEHGLWARQGEA